MACVAALRRPLERRGRASAAGADAPMATRESHPEWQRRGSLSSQASAVRTAEGPTLEGLARASSVPERTLDGPRAGAVGP